MEYIPYPLSDHENGIEVPYLQSPSVLYEYDHTHDFGRWHAFPERCKWEYSALLRDFSHNGIPNNEGAAALLQSWLYFGLLVEFFAKPVPSSDFLRRTGDRRLVITTQRLPDYISDWQRRIASLTPTERKKDLERINQFLLESQIFYIYCDTTVDVEAVRTRPRIPLPPEVLLSIAVLHSTLCAAKQKIFREETLFQLFSTSRIIDERLLKNGWCQSDLNWFQGRGCMTSLGMYYTSLLGPRPRRRNHLSCNKYRCDAYQVKESEYVTRHVNAGCGCELLTVPAGQLCDVIKRPHGIPLVVLRSSRDGSPHPTLELIQFDGQTRYIAISHVWAEGLGNPNTNGLPVCELARIQDRVNKASTSGKADLSLEQNIPFWMDTLCVPVQGENHEYRKLSIIRIAETFQRAHKTLILSIDLEATSVQAPQEELAFRITSNSWWRRLWTLQEGVLAQNMVFQFRDGVVNVQSMIDKFELSSQQASFQISTQLFFEGVEPLRRLESMREHTPEERANDLCDTIMFRSTSKLRDEAICLAGIMGLSTKEIVQVPDEVRLKKFILLQRHFRADFIFRLGARMEEDGYGWAPLTFTMNVIPSLTLITAPPPIAFADESGLHVSYPGLLFNAQDISLEGDQLLFVDEKDGNCYEIQHHRDWTPRSPLENLIKGVWPTQKSWNELCSERKIRQGAVILEEWPLKPDHTVPEVQLLDSQGKDLLAEAFLNRIKEPPMVVCRPSRAILSLVSEESRMETVVRFYAFALVSQSLSQDRFAQLRRKSHVMEVTEFKKMHKWSVF